MSQTDVPQPRTAALSTSPSTVTWASGTNFNGFCWLGLTMPSASGVSYKPHLFNALLRQEIPRYIQVPIINGVIDPSTSPYWNADVDPPGTQYVAYWFDSNSVLVAPASGTATPFSIASVTQILTVPTLPVPTGSSVPVPQ